MEVTFVNGTDAQQEAVNFVIGNLLNLPLDDFNLSLEFEWVADPTPYAHGEFGVMLSDYDSGEGQIKLLDSPWPFRGDIELTYEVIAHELGHFLFYQMGTEARTAVAALFGEASDDLDVLFPDDADYADRAGEGIADTFKEAFLPREYRRYANTTNRVISYSLYPEFRSLFRTTFSSPGVPLRDLLDIYTMPVSWETNAIRSTNLDAELLTHVAGVQQFQHTLTQPYTFEYSFDVLMEWFPSLFSEIDLIQTLFAWQIKLTVNGIDEWNFRGGWLRGDDWGQFYPMAAVSIYRSYAQLGNDGRSIAAANLIPHDTYEIDLGDETIDRIHVLEDARDLGLPPATLTHTYEGQTGDFIDIRARALGIAVAANNNDSYLDDTLPIIGPDLPLMPFSEPAVPGGELPMPVASLAGAPGGGGSRPLDRPVTGGYG